MRQGTEVEKPEHMKKVVLKMIVDNAEGFRVQIRGTRESEVCYHPEMLRETF